MKLYMNQIFRKGAFNAQSSIFTTLRVVHKRSILLWADVWQETELCDSIDACFPLYHSLLVIIKQHVLIGEIWHRNDQWFLENPNMAIRPLHVANPLFPIAELWDGSQDADALSGNCLEKDIQMYLVGFAMG